MLRFLQNLPVQRKLSLVVVATCALILVVACSALFGFQVYLLKQTFARDLAALAEVMAANSTGPLAFHDPKAGREILSALTGKAYILSVSIQLRDDTWFAHIGPAQPPDPRKRFVAGQGVRYAGNELFVTQPIVTDEGQVATLYLRGDFQVMSSRLLRIYGLILLLVVSGSVVLAFLLSSRLQKIVSEPILRLAETARSIADHRDYSVRARKLGRDEVGLLTDAFNLMLGEIQAQDAALQRARQELEQQVVALRHQISERERAELALRDSEQRYRSVVNDVKEVIYQTDREGRWLLLNRAWLEITGYPIEGVLGEKVSDFIHPDDLAEPAAGFDSLLEGKQEQWLHEIRIRTSAGSFRWIKAYASLQRGPDGSVVGATGTLTDITEGKQAQAELERLHSRLLETSRLAGMAEVATSVLHNVGNVLNSVNVSATLISETMQQSKLPTLPRVCGMLDEHQDDLADFLTHDLKGKTIRRYLRSLAEHLALEQRTALRELAGLCKNIDHIKDIVMMQQSYAKISGVSEVIPPVQLVEDALAMNASALIRHGVQVVRQYDEIPAAAVDKHKVLQILINLISNAKHALQATPRDKRQVNVRVRRQGQDCFQIEVSDNGVGIAEENLVRVFSHGFTTRENGHGFGLHSGALAAREMGGALVVKSDGPGQGATFTLTLPLVLSPLRSPDLL